VNIYDWLSVVCAALVVVVVAGRGIAMASKGDLKGDMRLTLKFCDVT
jgi:hypothetical protein